jgi:hypothetical protein
LQINNAGSGVLYVIFDTDIIINSRWYIICGTSNIQFGDTSLNPDGTRPKITINDITLHPGFIQNGTSSANGKSNIYVYNLEINAIDSTLDNDDGVGGGWVGQEYFGRGSDNNYIINCSSNNGPIGPNCGGIVGGFAGSGTGASLKIIGCSSYGNIQNFGGGITGINAGGSDGNITCECCWSEGTIGTSAGGIFGYLAGGSGSNDGTAIATNCYSTGAIDDSAGGIFGTSANGTCAATNCYSQGNIASDAGGIFGDTAASGASATNCYSFGPIFGSGSDGVITNCYVVNVNWSNSAANNQLTGIPTPRVGDTWVSTVSNNPYELNNMGYTPYAVVNITTSTRNLKKTYVQTIQPGQTSSSGLRSGLGVQYEMLSGYHPTMTISLTTGAITTTSATPNGTYNIVVRNTGSYNITTFTLTLTSPPTPDSNICFPAGTPIRTDQGNIPIEKINPKVHTIRNKKIEGIVRTKLMDAYLVCFEKNSLGPNVPCERTVMSGNHKVVVNGQMKMARELLKARSVSGVKTNSTTIHPIAYDGQPMYNVLMEDYDVILVNNMVCETLDPDNKMADLHAHLKYMSHERQQMLVSKFNGISEGNASNTSKSVPVVQGNPSFATKMKLFR